MLHLLIALIPLTAQAATPSPQEVTRFNNVFIRAVHGEKVSEPLATRLKHMPGFQALRKAEKKGPSHLLARGESMCRAQGPFLMCWQPVWQNGRQGIRFEGREDAFFPKSLREKEFAQELQKFATSSAKGPSKQSLWQRILPEAYAADQPIYNRNSIEIEDARMIYATQEAWTLLSSDQADIVGAMSRWSQYTAGLTDTRIACTKEGASATIDILSQSHKDTLASLDKSTFVYRTNGHQYLVRLAHPTDAPQCGEFRAVWSIRNDGNCTVDGLAANQKVVPSKANYVSYDTSGSKVLCHEQVQSCDYPLPQSVLTVSHCSSDNGPCKETQPLSNAEVAALTGFGDTNAEEEKQKEKLESSIRELFSAKTLQPDFSRDDLGLSNPSTLSGQQLSALKRLKQSYQSLLQRMRDERSQREVNLANNVMYNALNVNRAALCCKDDSCKTAVFEKTGVDLGGADGSDSSSATGNMPAQ